MKVFVSSIWLGHPVDFNVFISGIAQQTKGAKIRELKFEHLRVSSWLPAVDMVFSPLVLLEEPI